MVNARKIALEALLRVEDDNAYSNIVLNELFCKYNPEIHNRALAAAVFYGVLDTKITLDYIIKKLTLKPVSKIKPVTRTALRIGLYQLIFTDNIPQSAAVNESVKLVKNSREAFNTGFVNAVLRNYLRNPVKLPDDNSVFALSVRYSCPEWIIAELIADYDINTVIRYLEQSLAAPPLILRVNTLKNSAQQLSKVMSDLQKENVILNETALLITNGGINFETFTPYKNGLFFVQDLSSQKCAEAVMPKPGERILDMCAAPGGKSFSMAMLMNNTGEIVSCDIHEHRVKLIGNGAERLGINIIKALPCDAALFNENLGLFDAVLCDVPCSGLGIIRRKPDIKYKKEINFSKLEYIQSEILSNAASYLKPNGRIIYSTCTVRKNENEKIVENFINKNNMFKLQSSVTYMPELNGGDGFYIAVIVKK